MHIPKDLKVRYNIYKGILYLKTHTHHKIHGSAYNRWVSRTRYGKRGYVPTFMRVNKYIYPHHDPNELNNPPFPNGITLNKIACDFKKYLQKIDFLKRRRDGRRYRGYKHPNL